MSELLDLSLEELKESFSPGALPFSTADFVRALARTPGEALIASCFTGRVRARLLEEDEAAFREAVCGKVSVAIFFPFPLTSAATAKAQHSEPLVNHHREAWRTVVKFWKILHSFGQDSAPAKARLYRPRITAANVLFPPIFHRATLLCERINGRTKADLYSWTQGSENDGFYKISGRSLEDSELQAEAWELFFGGVYDCWDQTGELSDGDSYWQVFTGQNETEGDQ